MYQKVKMILLLKGTTGVSRQSGVSPVEMAGRTPMLEDNSDGQSSIKKYKEISFFARLRTGKGISS